MALSADKTLEQIVKDYMIERGFESLHGFSRYLHMAIQGLKELDRDVSGQIQKCELTVNSALTADLPANCIKVMGVAILKNNVFYPLDKNFDQAPVSVDSSGDDAVVTDGETVGGYFANLLTTTTTNLHGEFIGRIYGLSGRQNGSYVVNTEKNRIELNRNFSSNYPVYVFFKGNPQQIDGKFLVSEMLVEAIKMYIHWADVRWKHRSTSGQTREMAKNDWNNAKIKVAALVSAYRKTDYEDMIRKNFKMNKL